MMTYKDNEKISIFFIVYATFAISTLIVLILTRNKKKLAISNEKKFFNKLIGLLITMTNFFLFVPLLSYNSRMFFCPDQANCYNGDHLAIFSFAIFSFVVQFILIFYSNSLMTSCYPNETIPWSHFPSKIPFFKVIYRVSTILIYQGDKSEVIVRYSNIVLALCLLAFLYCRLTTA
jgi:hypothetical protein